VLASVITGECPNLDFRPSLGLTTPPTAETADSEALASLRASPSANSHLIPSALIFVAAYGKILLTVQDLKTYPRTGGKSTPKKLLRSNYDLGVLSVFSNP
jgi:hypothetical protein